MPIGSNPPLPPGGAPARKGQRDGPDFVCPACRQALRPGHVLHGVETASIWRQLVNPITGYPESERRKQRLRKLEERARRKRASGGYQPEPVAGKPVVPPSRIRAESDEGPGRVVHGAEQQASQPGGALSNQELRAAIESTHAMIRSASPGSVAIEVLEDHLSALLVMEQWRAHGVHNA